MKGWPLLSKLIFTLGMLGAFFIFFYVGLSKDIDIDLPLCFFVGLPLFLAVLYAICIMINFHYISTADKRAENNLLQSNLVVDVAFSGIRVVKEQNRGNLVAHYILCKWVDSKSHKEYEFMSPPIWRVEGTFELPFGVTVFKVHIDPNNYDNYEVDVSILNNY